MKWLKFILSISDEDYLAIRYNVLFAQVQVGIRKKSDLKMAEKVVKNYINPLKRIRSERTYYNWRKVNQKCWIGVAGIDDESFELILRALRKRYTIYPVRAFGREFTGG